MQGALCDIARVANQLDCAISAAKFSGTPNLEDVYFLRELSQYQLDILNAK